MVAGSVPRLLSISSRSSCTSAIGWNSIGVRLRIFPEFGSACLAAPSLVAC